MRQWKGGKNDIKQSVYLTGDMILFCEIDLLCHLFPHFFPTFCGAQEAASVIDEPVEFIFSPSTLPDGPWCNEQWCFSRAGYGTIVMFLTY